MKRITLAFLFGLTCSFGFAQNKLIDSLKHQLKISKQDTSRIFIMAELSRYYRLSKTDSAINYAQQALALSQAIKFKRGESLSLSMKSWVLRELGNLPMAVDLALKATRIAEDNHYQRELGMSKGIMGNIYNDLKNWMASIEYGKQAKQMFQKYGFKNDIPPQNLNIGAGYLYNNQLDSASYYMNLAYQESNKLKIPVVNALILRNFGIIQVKKGNIPLAKIYFQKSIDFATSINDHRNASFNYFKLAELYKNTNQIDSSIFFAIKALYYAQIGPFPLRIMEASRLLSQAYQLKNDFKKAYEYQQLMVKTNEQIYGVGNLQAMQAMISDDQARQQKLEKERIAYQNQLKQYAFLGGLALLSLIAFILYRNNQKEKKSKILLQEQKEKVESTLSQLKSTQNQLIQSEKLASLGELTAGIAHEIQNPLNFVNNFSEVSSEMVDEMKVEMTVGNQQSANEIADDLKQNLEKITLHGKRASSIVKGMLEHSKASSGEKELTDINALSDEYLRLSYHGLRAKDKNFNSNFKIELDSDLPKIAVIPQDMGRVLLNLINNAFYAAYESKKPYPIVTVTTKLIPSLEGQGWVSIIVKDNGNGIPKANLEKIFQPFFTTKPTGQGTGLGLSLAYDIVTKGHGGTIEVASKEGDGTEFTVKLPI